MVATRSGRSKTSADAVESTLVPLALNLLGWYGCNAFFNVLNKEALNRWPYPWAVAWLQLVAGEKKFVQRCAHAVLGLGARLDEF